MNVRIFVSLAALLLIAVNTALVVSEMPTCPYNEDGTLAASKGIPGQIICPHPDDYDCDIDSTKWENGDTIWIIWSESRFDPHSESPFAEDYYRVSYPGEYYERYVDTPFADYFTEYSFEVNLLEETGAICSGRTYHSVTGNFRPSKSDNENDFVMPGPNEDCYRFRNCEWENAGLITGWRLETVNEGFTNEYQRMVKGTRANERCKLSSESSSFWSHSTVVPCKEDDSE